MTTAKPKPKRTRRHRIEAWADDPMFDRITAFATATGLNRSAAIRALLTRGLAALTKES